MKVIQGNMPVYEKHQDVSRQKIIADRFVNAMGENPKLPHNFTTRYLDIGATFKLIECPYKYIIDYLVTTDYGKVVAVIECKWYWKSWSDVDYIQPISTHKVHHLRMLSDSFQCPGFFLMRNRDGLHYLKIDKEVLSRNRVEIGGRTDRGDKNDLEPMVHVEERYWDVYVNGQVRQDG